MSLKRYREAISPLEVAAKFFPDQAELQMNLGTAYLRTDDVEKARAAFGTALKLDSSPVMLNNVAYSLAEQNTGLDQAKEYAEKAVNEAEEASAKTRLSGLQMSDLDQPRQLAMFWDTLGWVDYRLNDFTAAEAYLYAAWALSQNPVIGRLLGQVYEQQKKKLAALHAYQLAYSASPLRPMVPSPTGNPTFTRDASDLEQDIRRLGGKLESGSSMDDLNHLRTIKLPRISSGSVSAEFFVLLGAGGKVEARFISGADSLRSAQKALESANYKLKFPDDRPARILRRGILGCYQYTGCSFVLMPPESVFSVQ